MTYACAGVISQIILILIRVWEQALFMEASIRERSASILWALFFLFWLCNLK